MRTFKYHEDVFFIMSMRRQGYEWTVEDLGNLPPKRLADLETPQSVFFSGIGDATLKNRQRTSADEFYVIHYFGSTPGLYGTGADWVPGGYVNFTLGTTAYFLYPDGRPGVGVSGDAQPYPDGIQKHKKVNAIFSWQNAIASCCRTCIKEWHGIPKGRPLTKDEIAYLTELVMLYIEERLPFLTQHGEYVPPIRKII